MISPPRFQGKLKAVLAANADRGVLLVTGLEALDADAVAPAYSTSRLLLPRRTEPYWQPCSPR
jgi:hypothetical protein